MKKKILIIVCALTVFLCNVRNIYAATGSDVIRTSFGSYTFESFDATLTIPYFNITLPSGARGVVMIYNFDTTYSGTAEFIFNYTIHTYDWYLYSFGGTCNFQQSSTNYRMKMQFEECSGFGVVVVGPSGSVANQLVLDPNYNTIYNLSAVDTTHEDLEQLYSLIDTRCGNVETYLSTISANLNSIKGYVDGLEGNTDTIEQSLTTLINSLNSLVSNTDQLESYTDKVESYLNTIALNTGIQNGMSLIGGITDLISLLSSTVQGGPSLFDVIDGILDTANGIQNLFDDVNLDNSDIVSAINSLAGELSPALANVPTYSLSAYMYFRRFNNTFNVSNYHYPNYTITQTVSGEYNADRRIYVPAKSTYILAFISNGNVTQERFPYYLYNPNQSELISVSYSYSNFANMRMSYILINNNHTGTITLSFDYAPESSTYIIPLYLGNVDLMTDEIQMITQYFANNSPDYTNDLDNIADLLTDLGVKFDQFNFDNSDLISILNDLYDSVSQLQTQITVTNNLQLGVVPQTSYMAYTFFQRFAEGGNIKQSASYGVPFYTMVQTTSNAYQSQRRIRVPAGKTYLLCFGVTTDINETNFPFYFYSNYGESVVVTYSDYRYSRYIEYILITNNYSGQISISFDYIGSNTPVYPLYLGDIELMTQEMQMITQFKVESTDRDYTAILDEIYDSINSLDLNVSVNVTNNDVQNITNDFDTNIEIVNNVEVDFNTSFEDTNALITDTDLTLDFDGLLSGIDVYHSIFSHFYNYSFFKYICIVCLVGGVILVLLG